MLGAKTLSLITWTTSRAEKGRDMKHALIPQDAIEQKIYIVRGHRVMTDRDLAFLYGVSTKRLNEQIKRNIKRFPDDFMFQLRKEEFEYWKSQFATSNSEFETKPLRSQIATLKRGKHRKYLPYVFTEQGVAMLSSVLNSEKAIQVNVAIMRAFVKLRQILLANKELAYKLEQLERKIEKHDTEIHTIFEAIRQLMSPQVKPKRKIGFHPD